MSSLWPMFIFYTGITVGFIAAGEQLPALVVGLVAIYKGVKLAEELEDASKRR